MTIQSGLTRWLFTNELILIVIIRVQLTEFLGAQEEMLRELHTHFPRYASRREQEVAAWKSSVAQIETARDFIQRCDPLQYL